MVEFFERAAKMQDILETHGRRIIDMNGKNDGDWRKEALNSIRPHLPPEKQKMADVLLKYLDMLEMLEKVRFMQLFMEVNKVD